MSSVYLAASILLPQTSVPSLQPKTGAGTWAANCRHNCSWLWLLASLGREKPWGGKLLKSPSPEEQGGGWPDPFFPLGPLPRGGMSWVSKV